MGPMSFDDKTKPPDDAALAGALGSTKKLWDEFVRHITQEYGPITEEWGFYKSWSLRLKRKKRTIVYLLPREGYFLCAYVFGEKATDEARRAKLPKDIVKIIEEARVYAEGRGFRLEVRKKRNLEAMEQLAAIKMAN
jgi:hypothetical protein